MFNKLGFKEKIYINFMVVLLLLLILLGSIIYVYGRRTIQKNIQEVLPTYAEKSAKYMANHVQLHKHRIEDIANRTRMRNMDWEDQRLVIAEEIERSGYTNIGLIDLSGTSRYIDGTTFDSGHRNYFTEALKGKTYISDILFSILTNEPIIIISTPVFDHDQNIASVLFARLETTIITDLTDNLKYGEKGYSYVINEQGTVISHHVRELFMEQRNFIEESIFNPEYAELAEFLKRMKRREQGIGQYPFMGSMRYMGFAPIDGTNWSIAVGSYESEVFKPVYQLLAITGFSFLVVLILGLFLTAYIGKNLTAQVNAIIKETSEVINNVVENKFDKTINFSKLSPDFETFAKKINTLIMRFKLSYDKLNSVFKFEKVISSMSSNFINAPVSEMEETYIRSLKNLAQFLKIDRTYLCFFHGRSYEKESYYQWHTQDAGYLSDYFVDIPITDYPHIVEMLEKKEIFIFGPGNTGLENMHYLQEVMSKMNLKYSIFVPLIHLNALKGYFLLQKTNLNSSTPDQLDDFDFDLLMLAAEAFINFKLRSVYESELQESQRKISTLISNLPGVVFRCYNDEKFTMNFISQGVEKLTGYSVEDFLTNKVTFKDITHKDDHLKLQELVKLSSHSNEAYELRYRIYTRQGDLKWILEKGVLLTSEENKHVIEGFISDVTLQKNAEEAITKLNNDLKEINRELEQIIYVTSHDLRSPLVNVDGFSQELFKASKALFELLNKKIAVDNENRIFTPEEVETIVKLHKNDILESYDFIQVSLKKMENLLNGLLFLSRQGRIPINTQVIDMNIFIKEILQNFDYQIKNKKINVTINKLPNCYSDQNLLNTVFTNLIENAIKYLHPDRKGEINISGKTGIHPEFYKQILVSI